MNKNKSVDIGSKIKKLRKKRGVSLKEVSKATGMSYSYLWGLEHNKHSITIVNLQRLSEFFNTDLAYFFEEPYKINVSFIGKGDITSYHTQDGLIFRLLTKGQSKNMQVMEIYHPPHSPSERRIYSHEQKGQEFITVLEGMLYILIGDKTYKLEEGDSIIFDSNVKHSIYTEEKSARFFLIASPPYGVDIL